MRPESTGYPVAVSLSNAEHECAIPNTALLKRIPNGELTSMLLWGVLQTNA
jgi:hypothetical protein